MGGLHITGRLLKRWHAYRAPIDDAAPGFTIVEVMIVLAVTGALFVATAILINGKSNQAGFNEAIQQVQSQVEQIMNEVSSGYFPNNGNFQCTSPNGGPLNLTSAFSETQGSNAGCIFAGKMLQFQVQGTSPEQYAIFTIASAQKNATGQEAQTLTAPKIVAPGTGYAAGYPNLTTTTILQNGLSTSSMWYNNGGSNTPIGAVAFVPTFAPGYDSNGDLESGSQVMNVVPVTGTQINATENATVDAANTNLASNYTSLINPSNGVSICFASGGTNESGLLVIGGGGHPQSVTMTVIDGSTTCNQ